MNMHKNARLTPRGRGAHCTAGRERTDAGGRCRSRRHLPADGSQVGLIDIVGKDWRDCRIAHPGRIGCTVRRPRR